MINTKTISQAQRQIAADFSHAFSNKVAREFVHKTMIDHYVEAILFHHPLKNQLNASDIKNKVTLLVDHIFTKLEPTISEPSELYELLLKLGRKNPNRDSQWFAEFDQAYDYYKQHGKLPSIGLFLVPNLTGYQSIIDFGCGDGEIAVYLRRLLGLPQISGVDILDWRSDKNRMDQAFKFYQHDFSDSKIPPEIPVHEIGIMHAMLHHVSRDPEKIIGYLQNAKQIISQKILVVEDVLYSPEDNKASLQGMETLQIAARSQPHFAKYLNLSLEEQKAVIIILDLLSNSLAMGVPEMNFPFGAQRLTDWITIFEKSGLKVKEIKVLGFQEHLFHRMSQCLFILEV